MLGLAAEVTATPAPSVAAPIVGTGYGRRWQQAAPSAAAPAAAPQANYVDANNDGVCDNCGLVPGTNANATGFVDADKNGVCDHFGTAQQGQGYGMGRGQAMRGQGRHNRTFGQGQGRGMNGANVQGRYFADADNNGVCDNYGTPNQARAATAAKP